MDNKMHPYLEPKMQPNYKLAEAYVPFQVMGMVFEPKEALKKGTLFPELYRPYQYNNKNKRHC